MMNHAPRKQREVLATTDNAVTLLYAGAAAFDGRRPIPGSVVFTIGPGSRVYFEGRVDDSGVINWVRKSGGKPPLRGEFNSRTGFWQIEFQHGAVAKGEDITISYDWQPHYLSGAEVMVRINNEDRLVPIEDLQAALYSRLERP